MTWYLVKHRDNFALFTLLCLRNRILLKSSGAQKTSYPVDTGCLSPVVKQPGREADHSPPSNADVKNSWSYTSTLPIRLHGMVLSYSQGKFHLDFTVFVKDIYS
jgi:hypothetical protein